MASIKDRAISIAENRTGITRDDFFSYFEGGDPYGVTPTLSAPQGGAQTSPAILNGFFDTANLLVGNIAETAIRTKQLENEYELEKTRLNSRRDSQFITDTFSGFGGNGLLIAGGVALLAIILLKKG